MKKIFLLFFTLLSVGIFSQESSTKKYSLTTITDEAGASFLNIHDAYLSPLDYTGAGVFYQRISQRLFSPENEKLSMESKIRGLAGVLVNPEMTATMTHLKGFLSWGTFYHFTLGDNFRLKTGGNLSGLLAAKNCARNVNNPVNFDIAANLNIAAEANYSFSLFKKDFKVYGNLEFPVIGCMFVPEGGVSYYQLFDLNDFNNAIHFSSFHNRQGVSVNTAIEVPFRYSVWRLGLGADTNTWTANDLFFRANEFKISLAIKYDIRRFAGTRNHAPQDFVKVK